MSAAELAAWAAFERRFGPLTVHERVDAAAALVAWSVARALGATRAQDPGAFLPRWAEADGPEPPGQDLEEQIRIIRRLQGRSDG
ncbi:MAG TPA: hypothetical protein VNM66_06320 [Thermodesulfobacteriota bacterium]|nr:hypothetical protein [Thermodesulfobacteriota bacterium]